MPAWLIALLTPLINKLVDKIGKIITDNIKDSIKESKRIKKLEGIDDPKAQAAYVDGLINK